MSSSRFSIATISRLVRSLSFKETIRCLTYLDRAAYHDAPTYVLTYVRTMMYITYVRSRISLLPKMRNLEASASSEGFFRRSIPQHRKKPSASSVEAFRFAEEAFRFAAKLRRKRKSGKTFRRAASFLKTCTVHADDCKRRQARAYTERSE